MSNESVQQLDESTFNREVMNSREPVLVDFHADWCQPCRAMAPTIDALTLEFTGRVNVRQIDIDDNQQLAERYEITSIPTLLLFKDGQVVRRFTGITSREDLARAMDRATD